MKTIPIWISNRHVHLSQQDAALLFGQDYVMKKLKDLSQPGQYACEETISIKWPKGQIDGVRILWPYRKQTQVEILLADGFKLWTKAPIRLSGDLEGTPGIEIIWPTGSTTIDKGVIIAKRHLHMSLEEAQEFGLQDGQCISVKVTGERGLIFDNVIVRANAEWALDMHIDVEEGNAAGLGNGATGEIL